MEPRRTTYRGTDMRSRLETRYARWLDDWRPGRWCYEPRAFAGAAGEWLPDFRIDNVMTSWRGHAPVYVEVKPEGWLNRTPPSVLGATLARVASIFESVPEAVVVLEEGEVPAGVTWLVECDDTAPTLASAVWLTGRHGLPVLGLVEPHGWAAWPSAA